MEIEQIDPRLIKVVEGRNPRMDWGDLDSLANSIEESGLHTPIKVEKIEKGFFLVDGERRLRAIRSLVEKGCKRVKKIPVLVVSDGHLPQEELVLSMLLSNDGKPFLPLEEAVSFLKLKELGLGVQGIASRIGRSVTYVNDRLALVGASQEVKKAIAKEEVSTVLATDIVKKSKGDEKKEKLLIEEAKTNPEAVKRKLYGFRLNKKQKEIGSQALIVARSENYNIDELSRLKLDRTSKAYISAVLDTLAALQEGTIEDVISSLNGNEPDF